MFEILMRRKYSRMGLFVAGENPEEVSSRNQRNENHDWMRRFCMRMLKWLSATKTKKGPHTMKETFSVLQMGRF